MYVCMHVCVFVRMDNVFNRFYLLTFLQRYKKNNNYSSSSSSRVATTTTRRSNKKTTQRDWGGAANGRKHSAHFASAVFVIVVIEKSNNVQHNQSGICKKQLVFFYFCCRPLPACESISKTTPLVSSGEHISSLSFALLHTHKRSGESWSIALVAANWTNKCFVK